MSRLRPFLARHGIDLLIVAAAVQGAVGTARREDPYRLTGLMGWVEMLAVAGAVLALLLRRRYPFGAPAALWLATAALSFLDGRLAPAQGGVFVAGMGAAILLGNLRSHAQALTGLAIVIVSAATVVYNDPGHATGDYVFIPVVFGIGWLVGYALHERTEQTEAAEERAARAERDREAAARVAVAEERARIARELHDVVAHAVSVMVLQVGAVRHRMPASQSGDRDALENVEQAGRTALAEMRRLLGAMRGGAEELELVPHPGLHDLDALLTEVRSAGLDVRLDVRGEPRALPSSLDLSAYRILQEGLTNALKHARAHRAEVSVEYGAAELLVEVRDDGRGPVTTDGLGHGLVGIAERVKIFGGEMWAGASSDPDGFVLRARLPMDGGRA